jgi:hypothetical protein
VNLLQFLSGKEEKSPREGFIYSSDDGDCTAMRMGRYKVVFAETKRPESMSGVSHWHRFAFPSSSTCAPNRSSAARTGISR